MAQNEEELEDFTKEKVNNEQEANGVNVNNDERENDELEPEEEENEDEILRKMGKYIEDDNIIGEYKFEEGKLGNLAPSENEDVLAGRWKSQGTLRKRKGKIEEDGAADVQTPESVKIAIPENWETGEAARGWSTFLLVSVGILGGGISIAIDIAVTNLNLGRTKLLALTESVGWGFFIWVAYLLVLLWIAVAITILIAPSVAGSGLPGLKCVVNGAKLLNFLTWRALFAKIFGLTFALGSGMIIGKEGPFVHLCAILGTCLMKTPIFRPIRKNKQLIQVALGAACATGVACHFGAPVGGVLFSIEITSSYYPTRNYAYGYLGAMVGAATWRYCRNAYFYGTPGFAPLILTSFSSINIRFGIIELLIFILLGIICGALGSLFIQMNSYYFRFLRWLKTKSKKLANPFFVAFVVGSCTAVATYPRFLGQWASLNSTNQLSDLINANENWEPIDPRIPLSATDWLNRNIFLNLFLLWVTRLALIPISIILPIPCGLFVPCLLLGGATGRFIGEAAYSFLAPSNRALFEGFSVIVPGIYAIVGAASLTASVTHTFSVAVIIFEITNNMTALIPVLVAVVTGVNVSKFISLYGIYESLARLKGLPLLPELHQDSYSSKAKDIMNRKVVFITKNFEKNEVIRALESAKGETTFPVVNDKKSRLLIGTVDLYSLQHLQRSYLGSPSKENGGSKDLKRSQKVLNKVKETLKAVGKDDEKQKEEKERQKRQHLDLIVKSVPIRFVEMHPIYQVHLLFVVMRLNEGYVTRNGKLKGVITRNALRDHIYDLDKQSTLLGNKNPF